MAEINIEKMANNVAEKAIQELRDNGIFIGRWISVSERLPTKEEYIVNNGLFIVSDGNRTYAEYFLMREIIADCPAMQELYDLYNKPLNVTHTPLKHYRIQQLMDMREIAYSQATPQLLKTHIENRILQELRPLIWDNLKTEKDFYSDKYRYWLDIWVEPQESEDT